MLDIKFIRENSELITLAATKKHIAFNVNELLEADAKRLRVLRIVEELRAKQNAASDSISKVSALERADIIESMKVVKDEIKSKEVELEEERKRAEAEMLKLKGMPASA